MNLKTGKYQAEERRLRRLDEESRTVRTIKSDGRIVWERPDYNRGISLRKFNTIGDAMMRR